ncbi:MAG: NUDIX hydrolase YfcD [Acidobacteria bacterium]|nr:NUDIX hydrolase YfcD [Acidobacteriota bacterium]
MSARDEIVTLVNERNEVTGCAPRWKMRSELLLHRATYIIVTDSEGLWYVQKRTASKDIYAGWWDPCTGGVVVFDESYEVAAERELAEELGIRGVPLTTLYDFYFGDERGRVWGRVFHCVWDGPVTPQPEEVEFVEKMSVEEIRRRSLTENFTPDGLEAVRRWSTTGPISAASDCPDPGGKTPPEEPAI